MKIKNNLVVVTGAASGLGAACAKHLLEQGAHVVMVDRSAALPAAATALGATGFECDVTDELAAQQVIDQAASLGPLRMLVNCAGVAPAKRMLGRSGVMPLAEFSHVIQINLIGTFNMMRLAAARMAELSVSDDGESRGVIINTASIAAFEGQIGQTAYAASKGGVVALTLPAARELAKLAIRVNCIAPGLMATPMLLGMPADVQQSLQSSVPMPPRLGEPEEFARLVQHIIENNYLNGSVLRLDGALRMAPV